MSIIEYRMSNVESKLSDVPWYLVSFTLDNVALLTLHQRDGTVMIKYKYLVMKGLQVLQNHKVR